MRSPAPIAALFVLVAAAPAPAQEGDEERIETEEIGALDQQTLDQAESTFFEGLAHFRASRFEDAARSFQRAWVLSGHRDMLYNVARSRAKLGDRKGAIEWYRAYLRTRPADETAVLHRIQQLGGDPGGPVPRLETPDRPQAAAPVDEGPRVVKKGAGPWPWVALGAGVVGLTAGAILGFSALDEAKSAREAERSDDAQTHRDASDSRALGAHIALGVGAAGALTAAYLWWRADDAAANQPRTSISVGVGTLGVGGAF